MCVCGGGGCGLWMYLVFDEQNKLVVILVQYNFSHSPYILSSSLLRVLVQCHIMQNAECNWNWNGVKCNTSTTLTWTCQKKESTLYSLHFFQPQHPSTKNKLLAKKPNDNVKSK